MGRKGVAKPLIVVVNSSDDTNTTGQAVSALRRLASNADNAVGMVRVSGVFRESDASAAVVLAVAVLLKAEGTEGIHSSYFLSHSVPRDNVKLSV